MHENLKLADGCRHSLLELSFPKNKVKLNESRPLKFYQVKQLKKKKKLTDNSAEKNLKENSKFNELWKSFYKTNKKKIEKWKEKYSNLQNLVSQTLSQISPSKLC